jgi:hypothetical protein
VAVVTMPNHKEQEAIKTDQQDLLAILEIRFGEIPEAYRNAILDMKDRNSLERLVLVAANVPEWELFTEEMKAGPAAFRLVGSNYNPISMQ